MGIEIIRGLFVNIAILTSTIMFANFVMHEKYFDNSLKNNIRNGLLSGLLGCLLMLFTVPVSDHIMLDFRSIPVIIMAIYVSYYAAIETAIIIGAFRLMYFGLNEASLLAAIAIIVIALILGVIGHLNIRMKIKWTLAVFAVSILTGISVYYLIKDIDGWQYIILTYMTGLVSVSVCMFYFIEFINRYNRRFAGIRDDAERDHLTGLRNSRHFDRTLKAYYESNKMDQKEISLLYIDIDRFKNINDRYGHSNGDIVLREMSEILKHIARSQDTISRRGGEEFTLLLDDCNLADASIIAERIRTVIENTEFKLNDNRVARITVSIGVASIPHTTSDESELLIQADKALYRAKQAGRNQVAVAGAS